MSTASEPVGAPPAGRATLRRSLATWAQTPDPRLLAGIALLAACALGVALAVSAGVLGIGAVPAVLRTALVGIAWFGLCGYAAARVLVRGELSVHRPLLVLPLGAALSSLALTALGLLHVPLKVSLIVVAVSGAGAALAVHRRPAKPATPAGTATAAEAATPAARSERSAFVRIALPLLLAGIVGLISLLPIFRAGFATVPGQNGDAILAVGTAVLLEHAPPSATRTDLPINHVPVQWHSKYPIYYALAAISTLAGQDPIRAFATVSALILALTALGLFLFARYLLRAPPWVALLALLIVPLDRIVIYVTIHPYYNELWGQFALPFMLLAGWRYVSAPDRRSAALFAVFLVLGLLAYPLMIPFPAIFLAVHAWLVARRRRAVGERTGWISALRLPRPRARGLLWVPVVVIGVPVVVVLARGFLEKTTEALAVIAPWTSLAGWHGTALPYLPWPRFLGMPESDVGALLVLGLGVLAWRGARRAPSAARRPLIAMVLVTVLIGVYFRVRYGGELFFFKDLAFVGPYVLMLALVGLAGLAAAAGRGRALLGLAGLAGALVLVPVGAAREISGTYEQATFPILGLRSWDHRLPRGTSIRLDMPASGYQLWVTYMFNDHPLCALDPLTDFFPHPPVGYKADYLIADADQPRPPVAIGQPLMRNPQFVLWRMNPRVPGPDVSTRHLLDDVTTAPIG
ncbi:MAG: hypothetical protein ACR2IP_11780 [Solirubrobacteraceae bacterium]